MLRKAWLSLPNHIKYGLRFGVIYQWTVCFSLPIILLAIFLFFRHVTFNKDKIFWWRETCDEGFSCTEFYFTGPSHPVPNNDFAAMVKELYLISPPKEPNRTRFDISAPIWKTLAGWYEVQKNLIEVFENRPPGFFVEVGAVDGEFMSQTLFLEKNLNWNGLLIEPDKRSFAQLVKMRRNAWLSPLCVKLGYPSVARYWLRDVQENLTRTLRQVLMSRSKLVSETEEGDEEKGSSVWVPCAPLSLVVKAIGVKKIDLLTVSTGGEEDILSYRDVILSKTLDSKIILFRYDATTLYTQPLPKIKGYIIDVKRSQLLVKLYVKQSYCELISTNFCAKIEIFTTAVEACYSYLCFGYLSVLTTSPEKKEKTS